MTDPIRDHAAAQPGIATYAEMLAGGPTRPWTPLGSRPAPARITPTAEQIAAERAAGVAPKPADAPAQHAAEPPTTPAGSTGRPDTATALSADHRSSHAVPDAAGTTDTAAEQAQHPAGYDTPAATWRPAQPGDTPGELVPEHGPTWPVDARPRPKPRPPWWRQALDRARALTHRED